MKKFFAVSFLVFTLILSSAPFAQAITMQEILAKLQSLQSQLAAAGESITTNTQGASASDAGEGNIEGMIVTKKFGPAPCAATAPTTNTVFAPGDKFCIYFHIDNNRGEKAERLVMQAYSNQVLSFTSGNVNLPVDIDDFKKGDIAYEGVISASTPSGTYTDSTGVIFQTKCSILGNCNGQAIKLGIGITLAVLPFGAPATFGMGALTGEVLTTGLGMITLSTAGQAATVVNLMANHRFHGGTVSSSIVVDSPTDTDTQVISSFEVQGTANTANGFVLPANTTSAKLTVTTNRITTCRLGERDLPYDSMPTTNESSLKTAHAWTIGGLVNDTYYERHAKCRDTTGAGYWHEGGGIQSFWVGTAKAPAPYVSTKFKTDDVVKTVGNTNLRDKPAGVVLGTRPDATTGTVRPTPPVALALNGTSYIWWEVFFSGFGTAWVAEDFLISSVSPGNPIGSPVSTKFKSGDTIKVIENANVRGTAGGATLGQQFANAGGIVTGGPVTAAVSGTSYTWWNVNFTTGVSGWVAESFIQPAGDQPNPTQTTPPANVPMVTVSVRSTSVDGVARVGDKPIVTWSATNQPTYCASSGDWSGAGNTNLGVYGGTNTSLPAFSSARTYTYSMICSNAAGNSVAGTGTITVAAAGAPASNQLPVVTVSVRSTSVDGVARVGDKPIVTWSATNQPTYCASSGDWSGAGNVTPGVYGATNTSLPAFSAARTYTYSMICSNAAGNSTAGVGAIVVAAPNSAPAPSTTEVTVDLTASPSTIVSGNPATLNLVSTNALYCTGTAVQNGVLNGVIATVRPTQTTTYGINCVNPVTNKSKIGSVTVNVTPALVLPSTPTFSFTVSPSGTIVGQSAITAGQSATLSWNATPATGTTVSCSSPDFSVSGTSGNVSVSPTQSKSYTLTCMASNGQGKSGTVNVSVVQPAVTVAPAQADVLTETGSGDTTEFYIGNNTQGSWTVTGGRNVIYGKGSRNIYLRPETENGACTHYTLNAGQVTGYAYPPSFYYTRYAQSPEPNKFFLCPGDSGTIQMTYKSTQTSNVLDAIQVLINSIREQMKNLGR